MDWTSNDSVVLLNPRFPGFNSTEVQEKLPMDGEFKGHIWLATSGSTAKNPGEIKYVALSKKAMLSSAAAINEHLKSDSKDVWINPLPMFHVGGLGILARSYLSGAKVWSFDKWDAVEFHQMVSSVNGTLSALVPAQVYDLVTANLHAPPSLRAIVVGGGRLNEHLYDKALELGWVVLPSYGMTEACSQIATAELELLTSYEKNTLKILPHVEVKINPQGLICLKGPSLLTSYAFLNKNGCELFDPKSEGWFTTADHGECLQGHLKVFGRTADFLKIGGESVDMLRLERILDDVRLEMGCKQDIALVPIPDKRLGHVIHMVIEKERTIETDSVVESYQQAVMPFEKVRQVHVVDKIPRSPLKKLLREEMIQTLISNLQSGK